MKFKVIFYDLAYKWEEEIVSDQAMTGKEAAVWVLRKNERPYDNLNGLIYRVGQDRVSPDSTVPDGECLYIHRLLGGG